MAKDKIRFPFDDADLEEFLKDNKQIAGLFDDNGDELKAFSRSFSKTAESLMDDENVQLLVKQTKWMVVGLFLLQMSCWLITLTVGLGFIGAAVFIAAKVLQFAGVL